MREEMSVVVIYDTPDGLRFLPELLHMPWWRFKALHEQLETEVVVIHSIDTYATDVRATLAGKEVYLTEDGLDVDHKMYDGEEWERNVMDGVCVVEVEDHANAGANLTAQKQLELYRDVQVVNGPAELATQQDVGLIIWHVGYTSFARNFTAYMKRFVHTSADHVFAGVTDQPARLKAIITMMTKNTLDGGVNMLIVDKYDDLRREIRDIIHPSRSKSAVKQRARMEDVIALAKLLDSMQ